MKKEYRFPCEQCGAKLKFSALDGNLKCSHCGHLNHVERSSYDIVEKDYDKAIEELKNFSLHPLHVESIKCNSCAAVFEIEENIHSSVCPYCSSAIVHETQLYRPIKPQGILPFKLTKKDARSAFKAWLKDLWFAPNKLKEYGANSSKLDGIFIPHWTYDTDTFSSYTGRRGDIHHVIKQKNVVVDGRNEIVDEEVEEILWTRVSGDLYKSFDDVLVMGTTSLKHTLSNWDLENLVDYDEAYLSGYESEVYSVELDEGLKSAKNIMQHRIRGDIKRQIGGDEQEIHSLDSEYNNITYKHILLPIYASAFKFGGKVYSYVINGRNGEISGDRPYSWVKIGLTVIMVLAAIGIAYYFYGQNR